MRPRIRPMEPKDVKHAVALLASHPEEQRRYGEHLMQLPTAWLKLLGAKSMITAIVEDTDSRALRVVACGASVFVTDDLLCQLKTAPFVWIGPELLRRSLSAIPRFFSAKQIREANSRKGLNLVAWDGVTRPARREDQSAVNLELWEPSFTFIRAIESRS